MRPVLRAALLLVLLLTGGRASAQSSFVTPDRINRAPAVTLLCVAPGGGAAPCGTLGNPLVITGQVAPFAGPLVSRSISLAAGQSTQLFPPNGARHYFAFQAPQSTYVWVNTMGGTAAPNAADCAYFAAGTLYESGNFVNTNAITIYAPVAVTVSAWEG